MKLDRNVNLDGKGKYALINLRTNSVEWGGSKDSGSFFVLKFKDKFTAAALHAYADEAARDGEGEWASEIRKLALVAETHPDKKKPD